MNTKLTPFGKAVRKLRIDAGVKIFDMAEFFNRSSAYISAVETGKRNVTREYVDKVIDYFNQFGIDARELVDTIDISQKHYKINLDGESEQSRILVAAFARKFPVLDDKKREKLMELIK